LLTFKSKGLSIGRKLQRLSADGAKIARAAIASNIRDSIAEGFERKVNPMGQAWAPRKDNLPHPLLQLTGAMAKGYHIDVKGPNLVITNNVVSDKGRPYPWFHQRGTVKMVARKTLPDKALSPHWKAEFDKTVRKALERLK
jgi:hypothetical protein